MVNTKTLPFRMSRSSTQDELKVFRVRGSLAQFAVPSTDHHLYTRHGYIWLKKNKQKEQDDHHKE